MHNLLFELNLYFIDDHVPYKFRRNPFILTEVIKQ